MGKRKTTSPGPCGIYDGSEVRELLDTSIFSDTVEDEFRAALKSLAQRRLDIEATRVAVGWQPPRDYTDSIEAWKLCERLEIALRFNAPALPLGWAFRLGRVAERMHVRPFEADVVVARRVRAGGAKSAASKHGTPNARADRDVAICREYDGLLADGMKATQARAKLARAYRIDVARAVQRARKRATR